MANGNNHDRLAQKVEDIERRIEERGARRDASEAEIREILVELATKVAAAEKAAERSPSWLQIVIAAGTLSTILAGLAVWTLDMTVKPLEKEDTKHGKIHEGMREDLLHYQADVTGHVKLVAEKQDDVRNRLARLEGQVSEINKRVDDVDKLGSRKWVASKGSE